MRQQDYFSPDSGFSASPHTWRAFLAEPFHTSCLQPRHPGHTGQRGLQASTTASHEHGWHPERLRPPGPVPAVG